MCVFILSLSSQSHVLKDSWAEPLPFFSLLFTSSHHSQASAASANSHTQWQALRLVKLMGYVLTTLPSSRLLFSLLRLHRVLVAAHEIT